MDKLDQFLTALQSYQPIIEGSFSSQIPFIGRFIAWFRTQWNNVATRWYVLPIIKQQNTINELWLAVFREQQQVYQRNFNVLERDQIALIEQVAELSYRLTCLEEISGNCSISDKK